MFENAAIPLGFAWSSPFTRWQGPLASMSALDLVVDVTERALEARGLPAADASEVVLGWTIPQPGLFYGAPTVAARLGAPGVTGPMISQACATGVAVLLAAALRVETSSADELVLALTTDRTSNSPLLVYPTDGAPGAQPTTEHWLLDAMAGDPWAGESMVTTAEIVARQSGMTRDQLDELTQLRFDQYQASLADDRSFQRRYMVSAEVPQRRGAIVVDADDGIHTTTPEGLAKLSPVEPDGVVTYGTQTHPADGAGGIVVTSVPTAQKLSNDGIARVLGIGTARAAKAEMPKAPVPAAQRALDSAQLTIDDVDLITTHNPFAVNDLYFSQQTGFPVERMNTYGSSLIYGHAQAATGTRAIAELVEALRERGGGIGVFTGCAAGDTGAAVVLRVE
ncbi:MAG: thiolase family protein [Acidimicrobiia bacterium]